MITGRRLTARSKFSELADDNVPLTFMNGEGAIVEEDILADFVRSSCDTY